jgi:hypothetical protein
MEVKYAELEEALQFLSCLHISGLKQGHLYVVMLNSERVGKV